MQIGTFAMLKVTNNVFTLLEFEYDNMWDTRASSTHF